MMTVIA